MCFVLFYFFVISNKIELHCKVFKFLDNSLFVHIILTINSQYILELKLIKTKLNECLKQNKFK